MLEKFTALRSWKAKAELSAINLVDESDAANPFISSSYEEDANEKWMGSRMKQMKRLKL